MLNICKVMVLLSDDELSALVNLARNERRDARSQAGVIIRDELIKRRLLEPSVKKPDSSSSEVTNDRSANS